MKNSKLKHSNLDAIIKSTVRRVLTEAAITFGEHTYPKYGNVLIMAGGAGSGKGFALENEIAFEGKHFDVDFLKNQMRKFQINSPIDKEFFQLYGKHISQTDMKNENDVSNLHEFCSKKGFDKQTIRQFIQHASNRAIKDNMIFDVTLQNIRKLIEIVSYCDMCGYNRENIHIVWVLNDFSVAQQQNANRSRTVNNDILTSTHVGVSKTIHDILTNAEGLMDNTDGSPIIDGDMWILFNKKNVDNFTQTSSNGGKYVNKINSIKIKEKGQSIKPFDSIMNEFVKVYDINGNLQNRNSVTVRDKVIDYVPEKAKEIWFSKPKTN